MQNRFRFRAWDKKRKKMIYDLESNFMYIYDRFGDYVEDEEDFITMQCTGLKDKNGKLIYEGDIIRYTEYELDEVEPEWEYTEIVWGENHCYPAFDLKVHEFDCNGLSYIFNEGWTIEIVNNIYEAKKIIDDCTKNC